MGNLIGAIASRLWGWLKMGLIIAVFAFLLLAIEAPRDCARADPMPWCGWLDSIARAVLP